MLKIGNVKPSPTRLKGFEDGGIMVFDAGDRVRRMWHGVGVARDLVACEVHASDGARWVMGRVRIHKDDKLLDSEDEKDCILLGIGPEITASLVAEVVGRAMASAVPRLGILRMDEVDTGLCDQYAFFRLLEQTLKAAGGDFATFTYDPRTGSSEPIKKGKEPWASTTES